MHERRQWRSIDGRIDVTRPPHRPDRVSLAALPEPVTIDLARTALVIVDMQNDFCAEGGWLSSIGADVSPARTPIPVLQKTVPRLRGRDVPVVWLNWGNRPDLANLPPNVVHVYDPHGAGGGIGDVAGSSDAVLTEGSWGAAIVDGLGTDDADVHVSKYRMSGFWDTPLDSILRARGIDTLLFAGVNVDQCVLATLIDAACIGYDCVLIEDASGTTSPDFCLQATLYNVRQCFGFTAVADDLLRALDE